VGLIAAALEDRGIATVCVQPVRHVAERVRPPRGVVVPFPLGYPLGRPNDPALQHAVLESMLRTLDASAAQAPVLVEFDA